MKNKFNIDNRTRVNGKRSILNTHSFTKLPTFIQQVIQQQVITTGGPYTFENGLFNQGGIVRLGGSLSIDTNINTKNFSFYLGSTSVGRQIMLESGGSKYLHSLTLNGSSSLVTLYNLNITNSLETSIELNSETQNITFKNNANTFSLPKNAPSALNQSILISNVATGETQWGNVTGPIYITTFGLSEFQNIPNNNDYPIIGLLNEYSGRALDTIVIYTNASVSDTFDIIFYINGLPLVTQNISSPITRINLGVALAGDAKITYETTNVTGNPSGLSINLIIN